MNSVLYIARKTLRAIVVNVMGVKRAHVTGTENIATSFATRAQQSTLATKMGEEPVFQTGMGRIAIYFATTAPIFTYVRKKVMKFVYQRINVHRIAQKSNQFLIFICAINLDDQQLALTDG